MATAADTTLAYDRDRKASMYARAGIREFWIVNLVERRIEVYRDPVAVAAAPFEWYYRTHTVAAEDGSIAPLATPDLPIKGADLLP